MAGSEAAWEKTDTGIKMTGNDTTIEGSITDGVLTLSPFAHDLLIRRS